MQSAFESLGLPDEVLPEALGAIEELGLQRKQALVQSVAKRMKVHMPVYVTWYQVVEFADPIKRGTARTDRSASSALSERAKLSERAGPLI